jgi:hypothetical protein
MSELRALLALSLAVSGCASTSGQEWLSSAVDQRSEAQQVGDIETDAVAEPRPRLSHSVTLGESYAAAPDPGAPVGAGSGTTVQVNVPVTINNMGGYGYGYSYGYGYGYPYGGGGPVGAAPARTTRSAAPKVGADFPAPPDYGPRALK